jgi:hypothetical protein
MEPTYSMPAEQAAEALMASMKLNGIDRHSFRRSRSNTRRSVDRRRPS